MPAARMYRRKPTVIEAVEFIQPTTTTGPLRDGFVGWVMRFGDVEVLVSDNGVPDGGLEASPDWRPFSVFNALHSSWVGFAPGDFLRVDSPGDVYPIDRATFEETYELVQEGP